MKTNGAPEKIYVNFPFGERHPERGPMVTKQGLNAEDIEYIRKDAFIEKTCEWIKSMWSETNDRFKEDYTGMLIEDFRKYMEGEKE